MNYLLWALAIAIVASWLPQAFLVFGYVQRLRSTPRRPEQASAPFRQTHSELINDTEAPEALVILCLRGGDPFLSRCIAGLVTQDYPRFHIRFMVDHQQDPALPVLEAALAQHNFSRYEIGFLNNPLRTCSLKCSSLAQAIEADWIYDEHLPGTRSGQEFVALLDADVIPHATWLRQLATALQPPEVGAATGNRWYIPDAPQLASLVRRWWNAAAIVQMYFYQIAWGGTLALKVSSIRKAQLLERWKLALCEDTMTAQQLAQVGLRLEFVPGLLMVNREECDFAGLVPWMRRQLLTTRLYHPLWPAVVFHGLSSAALVLWGWATVAAFLLTADWTLAAVTMAMMVGYQVCLTALLIPLGSAVKSILQARGEASQPAVRPGFFQATLSIAVTQAVYTYALITCLLARQTDWRGIRYQINGPWNIQMLEYHPYRSTEVPQASSL